MSEKILLIEDDTYLRELYATILKTAGYEVLEAVDGEQGWTLAQQNHDAKLMILDILLPKHTGIEVLEKVKSDPGTEDIPVLVLTNLSADNVAKKAMELGAYDYVIKMAISNEEVVKRVKECIEKTQKENNTT